MASRQQVHQVEDAQVSQFNLKKKRAAVVSEQVSEAQALLQKKRDVVMSDSATVGGIMKNSIHGPWGQVRPLKCEKVHQKWGEFVVPPTDKIGDQAGSFVQDTPNGGTGPLILTGCKAAVIYSTFDDKLPQFGYLLGWYKSRNPSLEPQVYVEVGEPSKLLSMEWDEIEKKIDASGSKSESIDRETYAFAIAEIHNFSIGMNTACLGANFTRLYLQD